MHKFLFLIMILFVVSCNQKPQHVPKKDTVVKKQALKEIDTISGIYKTDSIKDCEMTLQITNRHGKYFYHLVTSERNIKGKVHFESDDPDEKYLVLEGIEWDEFAGDISGKLDNDEWSGDENPKDNPTEVSFSMQKDTLSSQNSGNAMNYYTVFGECGQKYILLTKR